VGGNASLDATAALALGNTIGLAGANLTVLGSNDLTLTGPVFGAGGLIKDGAARLTLSGANTFNGGTTINAGTLALGAGGSLPQPVRWILPVPARRWTSPQPVRRRPLAR
jgi:autotransporter-associated beta strand protein